MTRHLTVHLKPTTMSKNCQHESLKANYLQIPNILINN